mmetsp:Transcript_21399/g.51928  ORF Transcript_21399/g.51928 Transcript_21399/m.51928 type:complete len:84 (+) Transcript_21399:2264-2515(+)
MLDMLERELIILVLIKLLDDSMRPPPSRLRLDPFIELILMRLMELREDARRLLILLELVRSLLAVSDASLSSISSSSSSSSSE